MWNANAGTHKVRRPKHSSNNNSIKKNQKNERNGKNTTRDCLCLHEQDESLLVPAIQRPSVKTKWNEYTRSHTYTHQQMHWRYLVQFGIDVDILNSNYTCVFSGSASNPFFLSIFDGFIFHLGFWDWRWTNSLLKQVHTRINIHGRQRKRNVFSHFLHFPSSLLLVCVFIESMDRLHFIENNFCGIWAPHWTRCMILRLSRL